MKHDDKRMYVDFMLMAAVALIPICVLISTS